MTKLHYVDDNLSALAILEKWDVALEKQIEEALGNGPTLEMDWRKWCPTESRRIH